MASAPYKSLKGVNLVALHSVVLCDQMTFGSSSTHLPSFWSCKHFFDAVEDDIVGSFYCSVGSSVVYGSEHDLRASSVIELSAELRGELLANC